MRNDKPNIIVDKTFNFSLIIIEYSELLLKEIEEIIKILSKIIASSKKV